MVHDICLFILIFFLNNKNFCGLDCFKALLLLLYLHCVRYILMYPEGCDVRSHLSVFLSVANHHKLPPGWSHLAQFTIAVVNKDSKKSKFSGDQFLSS